MSESDSKCQQDDLAILKSQSTDCTDQSIECIVHECYNSYIQKGVDPELVSNLAKSKIYDSGSCISSYVEKLETVMDTYINLKDELSSIEQQLIREVYHDCNDPYSGLTRESTSSSLVLNTYKEQLLNVNEIIVSKYFLNSNCSNQNEQKPPKIKRKSNNYSKKDIEIIKKTMEKLHKRYNYNNINYKQKPRQNECIQQISVPSEIRFENHQPSKKYVKKLKIINISKNSIRITVKGPKSDEFKIYTGDCHKESSLLAPGMHCIQEIIFNPKSTNDYTDTLEIATENQSKIIVNLIAEHEKPILNLAKQINIGQCLIECKKIVTIKVKNTGGVSTFFITTLQNWRNKSNKEIIFESQSFSNEILIYPHMFKLNKNESGHLNIHFNPNLIQKYSEKFVILSDNCYLNEFEIYGEGVYFDITLWEDVEMTKVLNKSTIVDSSNIGFQKIKSIFIKNNRDIKIPLCWFIGSETFKSDKNNKISSNFVYEDQLEKHNCPFEINPSYAVLNSQEIVKFDIVFNPKNIGHFANIAKLYFTSNLTFNFEQLKKNNQNENIFDNGNEYWSPE
ncbi:hypothetical protein A3Q56_02406 [Intoshia linei]|uniref:Deleted in lung and esophageal cancer protein 1 Ig-like domain-containing protein n=1 Tax=Intoshia linei TaxID=1819745 RepID=A0A177B6E3_9BILA|nr:hypothetical protein A3Q56_02406 [Intoshia linei]